MRLFSRYHECKTASLADSPPVCAVEKATNVAVGTQVMSQIQHTCHDRLASQMVKHVHQSVAKESLEFLSALRRYNYVTPTSYLEVLSTYRNVLTMKRLEVGTLKNRLQVIQCLSKGWGYFLASRSMVEHQYCLAWFCPILQTSRHRVNRFPQLCTSPVSAADMFCNMDSKRCPRSS